jgi:hypothetical protein
MGGGEQIEHEDIVDDESWAEARGYFSDIRIDIFYYCLIAHQLRDDAAGWGGGSGFAIAGYHRNTPSEQTNTFLHELGECILDVDPIPSWFEQHNEYWHCSHTSCAFYYSTFYEGQDYCSDCWTIVTPGQGLEW